MVRSRRSRRDQGILERLTIRPDRNGPKVIGDGGQKRAAQRVLHPCRGVD